MSEECPKCGAELEPVKGRFIKEKKGTATPPDPVVGGSCYVLFKQVYECPKCSRKEKDEEGSR